MINVKFKTLNSVIINMNLKKYRNVILPLMVAGALLSSSCCQEKNYDLDSDVYKVQDTKKTGDLLSGRPSKGD